MHKSQNLERKKEEGKFMQYGNRIGQQGSKGPAEGLLHKISGRHNIKQGWYACCQAGGNIGIGWQGGIRRWRLGTQEVTARQVGIEGCETTGRLVRLVSKSQG